jgi:hypothetical protein
VQAGGFDPPVDGDGQDVDAASASARSYVALSGRERKLIELKRAVIERVRGIRRPR